MKIWKIAIDSFDDFDEKWILPNGNVVDAVNGHEDYVRQHYDEFGGQYQHLDINLRSYAVYKIAFERGAIRYAVNRGYTSKDNSISIEGKASAIRKNIEKIHKMAKSIGTNIVALKVTDMAIDKMTTIEELYSI